MFTAIVPVFVVFGREQADMYVRLAFVFALAALVALSHASLNTQQQLSTYVAAGSV